MDRKELSTMINELRSPMPMFVPSSNRTGLAYWAIDYGPEHHVLWGVVMDDDGSIFWHSNAEVRVAWNKSLGRNPR